MTKTIIPKYEVYGIDHNNCKQYRLAIRDVVTTWDGKTVILHVELPSLSFGGVTPCKGEM